MSIRTRGQNLIRILCLLVCALLLSTQAFAAGNGALTLYYDRENVRFDVFQVTQADGSRTDPFADYPVTLPSAGSSNRVWREAAVTLAAYAAQDDLSPTDTGQISGGQVTFSGLTEGLYLVIGASVTSGNTVYTPNPFLIYVDGSVSADTKEDGDPTNPDGSDVTYQVVKEWRGGSAHRTSSVTIQLIRNGVNDRQVTLNAGNGWSYSWTSSSGVQWQVAELNVPDGFTVSVDREGQIFTVTNIYHETSDPGDGDSSNPDEPSQPDTPDEPNRPDDPGTPEEPGKPNDPSTPEELGKPEDPSAPDEPGLPQTGQLWWPVLALGACGGVLVAAGWIRRRSGAQDHEEA